eukprot:13801073-Ditylum_brightwellii.AAC.1
MTANLQENIVLTLNADYEIHENGGMLKYALMIDKVINLSEKAIKNMTYSIKAYDVFQSTSDENFNTIIFTWHHNVLLGTQLCPHYKSFFTKVEEHCKDMVVGGKWDGTANQGTAFKPTPVQPQSTTTPGPALQTPTTLPAVTNPQTATKDVKCHFCGGTHL